MTLIEAGKWLGVSPDTLRRQAGQGKLAAVKRGRDWFTTMEAVEAYKQQHLGRKGWGNRRQSQGAQS